MLNRIIAGGSGALIIAMFLCAFVAVVVFGGGGDSALPTPLPTLVDDDAELIREVGAIVRPIVEASAGAVTADTSAAHQPTLFEKALLPGALALVGVVFCLCAFGAAVAFLVMHDRQKMAALKIRAGELRLALLQAKDSN